MATVVCAEPLYSGRMTEKGDKVLAFSNAQALTSIKDDGRSAVH
jgi:hypothetical protein